MTATSSFPHRPTTNAALPPSHPDLSRAATPSLDCRAPRLARRTRAGDRLRGSWLGPRTAITLGTLAFAAPALAVDTLEPLDPGVTDAELYLAAEGLGAGVDAAVPSYAAVLGAGLTPRSWLYLTWGAETDHRLGNAADSFEAALGGTAVETEHVDLDLNLTLGSGAPASWIGGGFELNLDASPDQDSVGLFLNGCLTAEGAEGPVDLDAELALGAYWTFRQDHQLLLSTATPWALRTAGAPGDLSWRGVALGYNACWWENVELIHELQAIAPADGVGWNAGVSLGFIATLP